MRPDVTRFESPAVLIVGGVVDIALVEKLPDCGIPFGSRTEPGCSKVAPESAAPQKAHLRIEVVADYRSIELEPIAVGAIVEVCAIADGVSCAVLGSRVRSETAEADVRRHGEIGIETQDLIAAGAQSGVRPIREQRPNRAASQYVKPNRTTVKFFAGPRTDRWCSAI